MYVTLPDLSYMFPTQPGSFLMRLFRLYLSMYLSCKLHSSLCKSVIHDDAKSVSDGLS